MNTATFRNRTFRILEGTTHPAYSLACFQDDESAFRDRYWNVQPGEVVIDVGASYGAYTLTALAVGGYVWAFEPEPSVFPDLVRNVVENGWNDRCFCIPTGLWDAPGTQNMREYAPHWPEQTITAPYPMQRLDDISDTLERLDWMKIDVEGAELRVLRGALETIRRFKPRLVVEAHVFMDAKIPFQVRELLPEYSWTEEGRDPCVMMIGSAK